MRVWAWDVREMISRSRASHTSPWQAEAEQDKQDKRDKRDKQDEGTERA